MTVTLPQLDDITHLDEAWLIPCSLLNCRAGHPEAEWISLLESVCGCQRTQVCCDPCRLRIEALHAVVERGPWRCLNRHLVTTPSTARFLPLKEQG